MTHRGLYEAGIGVRTIHRQGLIDAQTDDAGVCWPCTLPGVGGPDRGLDLHRPGFDVRKRRWQPHAAAQAVPKVIKIGGRDRRNSGPMDGVAAEQEMGMVRRGPEVPIGDPDQRVYRRAEFPQRQRQGRAPCARGQPDPPWRGNGQMQEGRFIRDPEATMMRLEGPEHAGGFVAQYAASETSSAPVWIPDDSRGQRNGGQLDVHFVSDLAATSLIASSPFSSRRATSRRSRRTRPLSGSCRIPFSLLVTS